MKENRLYLFILLAFSFFTFVLFLPIFFGKVNLNGHLLVSFYAIYGENLPFKDTGWDQLRIYFPFYKITLEALRHLSIPFWNPYAFSGHTHFADFQTAVLYPLNLFGLLLPQIGFWHLLRITPTIFASFFTFLYLRNLKLSPIASFFGGLIFGFSPFIITWGEEVVMSPHSIIYLPLVLLAIDKLVKKFVGLYFFILAASVSFSIFAGYLQTTIYLLIFSVFYLLYRAKSQNLDYRFYIRSVSSIALGIIISSIQLFPSIQLFFNSQRSGVDFSQVVRGFLLPPVSLITYLAPDFFGNPATRNHFLGGNAQYYEAILFIGIAPLLFSFFSLIKKRSSLVIFFMASAIISLSTVVDSFFSRFFVSLPIPLVSTAIPHRILFVPAFSIAVLGTIGLDLWLKTKKVNILGSIIFFASLYICLLGYVAYKAGYFASEVSFTPELVINIRNLVIPLGVFAFIVFTTIFIRNREYVAILIILATGLNIFYFSNKYLSFSEQKYVFPKNETLEFITKNQGIDRTLFVGDRKFSNNFATQYAIFNPEGYDSLNNGSYSNFVFEAQRLPKDYINLRRSDAELGFRETLDIAFMDEGKRKLLNILGVRYLVVEGEDRKIVSKFDGFIKVFDQGKVAIFKNETAFDRAFLSSDWQEIDSPGLKAGDLSSSLDPAIIPDINAQDFSFGINKDSASPNGKVEIVSYEPSNVKIRVNSPEQKFLILTDNYYNGWKAKVDGQKAEIFKASSTFRAVEIGSGEHQVEFYYDSDILKLGAFFSLVGILTLVFVSSKGALQGLKQLMK